MSHSYPVEEARRQAVRLHASQILSKAPRRRQLLAYLVEQTLAGCGGQLKEYTIGCDVYGLTVDFDPRKDPRVRVELRRLRDSLDRYYAREGARDPIRIVIPIGTFQPEFRPHEIAAVIPLSEPVPAFR